MRTAVRLPEDLLNRARRKAVEENRTFTSLIGMGCEWSSATTGKTKKEGLSSPGSAKPGAGSCLGST
jgi:hypothetical protein